MNIEIRQEDLGTWAALISINGEVVKIFAMFESKSALMLALLERCWDGEAFGKGN